MLEQSWEVYATKLANANDGESLVGVVNEVVAQYKIDLETPANVIYAYDTRLVHLVALFFMCTLLNNELL